ncbi:MAG: histidinol dehydrogenase [Alphaproteobacteria bacterium]|nr:histidinol dehydrogenase [Alphaproteobacteria bacterium]
MTVLAEPALPPGGPRLLRLANLSPAERDALMMRRAPDMAHHVERARPIVEAVRDQGDRALVRFAEQFDGVLMSREQLRVSPQDFTTAPQDVPDDVVEAIAMAADHVRLVHERQRPATLDMVEVRPGVMAGDRHVPIDSVACYVPRGKGAFPSVALMTAIPAVVAGVKKVVIVTPPGPGGRCDPATLVAARAAGVEDVCLAGGAQAVAAAAFGTETVPRCVRIVGPGSPWVGAAMTLCADYIEPGPPAGPSEAVVFADDTADVGRVALDLLIEAEHGDDSTVFLVTWNDEFAEAVADAICGHLENLSRERRHYARAALGTNGGLVIAGDAGDALDFVNAFAPEHLQIASRRPRAWLDAISNAGEILLGQDAPFSMANYMIGVNAVLPTGGKAASRSALGVMDFLKRQSIAELTPAGHDFLAPATRVLADYEGFDAHALAITARQDPS